MTKREKPAPRRGANTDGITAQRPADQLSTGIEGLDRIIRGGLRRSGLHVMIGGPGTGKSIIAHQAGAHHIRHHDGRVLYLTAMVESHQTLVSQARTFPFFDPSSVASTFYYASLYSALERGALRAMQEEITKLVRERSPSLLIIDGLHALKLGATSQLDYQRFVHELEAQAAMLGVTTLLLTHPRRHMSADPTFTIADGIFRLRMKGILNRNVRELAVVKLRGVGHLAGWHTFRITNEGARVYPRQEALVAAEGLPIAVPGPRKLGFQVKGLDAMLGGGLSSSSVTLVPGTPGSGKTLLGLAFLAQGAKDGEKGLYIGFHETPDRLLVKADGVRLPLRKAVERGTVTIDWTPPAELLADEQAERILELIERTEAKRLVLDSVDELRRAAKPGARAMPFLSSFLDRLRSRGVSVFATQDLPRIAGPNFDLPVGEISPMVDHLLHLRYVELHAELRRLIVVLKTRDAQADHTIRELHIEESGMRVGDRFAEGGSFLTGMPNFGTPDRR